MKLSTIAACVAGLAASASAFAYPTWNVNDVAVGGVFDAQATNTVDVLNGRYSGSITQTFVSQSVNGSVTTVNSAFTESGVASFGSYFLESNPVATGLGYPIGALGGYGIYGTFTVSGSTVFETSGGVTSVNGSFSTGNVELWLDRNKNSLASSGGILSLTGSLGDDLKIGSASLISGSSIVISDTQSGGSYSVTFGDLVLDSFGEQYWNLPNPFYSFVTLSGENEDFNPNLTPGNYVGTVIGDASINVPEPATIALLGLGILGCGAIRRRKAS